MFKRLTAALYLRRLSRDLAAVGAALAEQNALLLRLVDHLAPEDPRVDRPTVIAETGLTHLNETEAYLALDYISRTEATTGHTPDEEEVLVYLADEKTTDLHKRLVERDAELARISEARRW